MQNKNQVVIYGRHAVFAALANPQRSIVRVVCLKENAAELRGRIGEKKLSVVERRELEKMLPREAVHQGMAAVAEMLPGISLEELCEKAREKAEEEVEKLRAKYQSSLSEQAALEPAGVMGPLRGESRAFGRRIRRESGESLRHPGRGQPFGSLPRLVVVNSGRGARGESLVRTDPDRERNPQYNQVKQRQTESVFCIYLHEAPFAFWVARNEKYGYGQEASRARICTV